jgi:hypothetical protein
MIELNKYEKLWILLIKNQLKEYPLTGKWTENLKPLFIKIYGWYPNDNQNQFLSVIFSKLLDIMLKITDKNFNNRELKELFFTSFNKDMFNKDLTPIERTISELCGIIQSTRVIDEDGSKRFDLTIEKK